MAALGGKASTAVALAPKPVAPRPLKLKATLKAKTTSR
jgi:hypothetical protein